ncbi:MAG: AAA family ATPase [Candidatus Binatia bacterium]
MQQAQDLFFRPFRLDVANERLWRRSREVSLRPKTFAVLRYLLEHADRLVTKEELLDTVWPDTSVSDVVPLVCIRELRKALGDEVEAPRFIETVPRRGYRFIAPVTTTSQLTDKEKIEQGKKWRTNSDKHAPEVDSWRPTAHLVGREMELAQLDAWLAKAALGERQIIFITGESGIGKTALIEAFLQRALAVQPLWLARGQCIEHYGAGEAYLPVLDALGRLHREMGSVRLVEILRRHAPTWLGQMPSLLQAADLDPQQHTIQGSSQERMLREIAEALEALTHRGAIPTPPVLVLWLEDLHWSDVSTLDLLSFLARRREQARLLIIGAYRPAEVFGRGSPLPAIKQDLQLHERCEELGLSLLNEEAVAEYLQHRLPLGRQQTIPSPLLARKIHQRTDGNPLFMVTLVSQLLTQHETLSSESTQQQVEELLRIIPKSLQQMIEQQVSRLSFEEQQMLEVASVAGVEFSAATLAAGLGEEIAPSETRCMKLTRYGQFLRTCGTDEWPDGALAGRYGFLHTLYRDALYERLTVSQRMHLHRRIGERKEAAYGAKANAIAAELAVHFTQGRDYQRAVRYLQQAADNAVRRSAFQEALGHITKGLELLHYWPVTPERTQQELLLHMTVLGPLMAIKGASAPGVERAYSQIWELHQRLGETVQPFMVVLGLWTVHLVRGEQQKAQALAEQLMERAQDGQDPLFLLWAHHAFGVSLFFRGEFIAARTALEKVEMLYDAQQHFEYMFDPRLAGLSFRALLQWTLGYPEQALQLSREAITWGQQFTHPYSLALAFAVSAWLHENHREGSAAQERAETVVTLAREHGFAQYEILGVLLRGGASIEQGKHEEGIMLLHQGIDALRTAKAELGASAWLTRLATACLRIGRIKEGNAALAEAAAVKQCLGERFYEAELCRIKGELLQQSTIESRNSTVEAEAEEYFLKALSSARRQQAKTFELRAAMSLSRLWRRQGKKEEAWQLLAEVYDWFTEGFDTTDLKEAQQLLSELTAR